MSASSIGYLGTIKEDIILLKQLWEQIQPTWNVKKSLEEQLINKTDIRELSLTIESGL